MFCDYSCFSSESNPLFFPFFFSSSLFLIFFFPFVNSPLFLFLQFHLFSIHLLPLSLLFSPPRRSLHLTKTSTLFRSKLSQPSQTAGLHTTQTPPKRLSLQQTTRGPKLLRPTSPLQQPSLCSPPSCPKPRIAPRYNTQASHYLKHNSARPEIQRDTVRAIRT